MPRFPSNICPHCNYALEGLPDPATRCPECGGELSQAAFTKAAARRLMRHARARMALLISPVVGMLAMAPFFLIRFGAYLALAVFVACLWAGAAIALYASDRHPDHPDRLKRAVARGLPLGIGYCLALFVGACFFGLFVLVLSAIVEKL